jgi:hypothetical protein
VVAGVTGGSPRTPGESSDRSMQQILTRVCGSESTSRPLPIFPSLPEGFPSPLGPRSPELVFNESLLTMIRLQAEADRNEAERVQQVERQESEWRTEYGSAPNG